MEKKIDHNALLLQVMAHDLLAPLTAVKWQLELLAREGLADEKRKEYMRNLSQSTELGITLTKHAHVAGRVLTGAYTPENMEHSLSDVVRNAVLALVGQYERHGVALDIACEEDGNARVFDSELVGVLLWSLAKFFLASTPPQSSVAVRGMCIPMEHDHDAVCTYAVLYTAPNIPEASKCVDMFVTGEVRGEYDQAFVFARLTHEVASLLGVQAVMRAEGTGIIAEVSFVGGVSA